MIKPKHHLSPPPLPDGVDSHHFREGELQQPPLFLIQEGDTGPVYGHNKTALRQWRAYNTLKIKPN